MRMSTSSIVKCSSCNIVINELLTFVRCVMDYMDEESIHQLCISAFSAEQIINAKSLLFESMPNAKKMPLRRKQDKKRKSRDMEDIVSLMKSSDPQTFPVFVARDLHMIPPVTFDHVDVTRFLKEIVWLKNQVSVLEEKMISCDQFNQLKEEIAHLRNAPLIDDFTPRNNVNKRRGACLQSSFDMYSGPIGLQYVPEEEPIQYFQTSADNTNNISNNQSPAAPTGKKIPPPSEETKIDHTVSVDCMPNAETERIEQVAVNTSASAGVSEKGCRVMHSCAEEASASGMTRCLQSRADASASTPALMTSAGASAAHSTSLTRSNDSISKRNVMSSAGPTTATVPRVRVSRGESSVKNDQLVVDPEWQVVVRKKSKQYKLIGQRGCAPIEPEGKFRAADVKVPLLISNVSKEASVNDIVNYVQEKTNEAVSLKRINMRKSKQYNAYKLYVSRSKLNLFLKDDFWPSGIRFRRFVHFKYKTNIDNSYSKLTPPK